MPTTLYGYGTGIYSTRQGAKGGSQDNNPAIAKNPSGEGGPAGGPNANVGAGNSDFQAEKPSGGNSGADQSSDPSDQGGDGQASGDQSGAGNSAATSGESLNPASNST